MRPVNLIPKEERSGSGASLRGGPLVYVIVGAMVLLLVGVTLLVVTNNQISDRKAEIENLQGEITAEESRAASLASYTALAAAKEQRVATVTSLADSRFDWERVMRELALILPDDVWLTNLTGTASPSVAVSGATSVALRSSISGPALEMVGCAKGQDAVAGFVSALKEIDGVTRVGMQSSSLGEESTGGAASTDSASASSGCQTQNFIAQFEIVVAFDAAPVPPSAGAGG